MSLKQEILKEIKKMLNEDSWYKDPQFTQKQSVEYGKPDRPEQTSIVGGQSEGICPPGQEQTGQGPEGPICSPKDRPSKKKKRTFFTCKDSKKVIDFQSSRKLKPDGKIGGETLTELFLDPKIGASLRSQKITFKTVMGNPQQQKIVCDALGSATTGQSVAGGGTSGGNIVPNKYGSFTPEKCPPFIKPNGPYTDEEIQTYVANYVEAHGRDLETLKVDPLVLDATNVVYRALSKRPSLGCGMVVAFIKQALKQKGKGISGEYTVPLGESKNWILRTKEDTSNSLFERLVKDSSKK
jgi:hypothetical protein